MQTNAPTGFLVKFNAEGRPVLVPSVRPESTRGCRWFPTRAKAANFMLSVLAWK